MRVLIVLFPGDAAGAVSQRDPVLRFEHFLESYYFLIEAGAELVVASPDGGYPLMKSLRHDRREQGLFMVRFMRDETARETLSDTVRLDQIVAEDFDGAFCIGATNPSQGSDIYETTIRMSRAFLGAGKPLVFIPGGIGAGMDPREGLLVIGEGTSAPSQAVRALFGVIHRGGPT